MGEYNAYFELRLGIVGGPSKFKGGGGDLKVLDFGRILPVELFLTIRVSFVSLTSES